MTEEAAVAKATKTHQQAADEAVQHLQDAADALHAAYDHPHHSPRLENIETQLRNTASIIAHMPEEEDSRADYAERLLEQHRARQLPAHLPDHAERLLTQELERTA